MCHHNKLNQAKNYTKFFKTFGAFLIVLFVCLPAYGQAPSNDECTAATVIPSIPFTDNVNTTTATNNSADPILSCNAGGDFTDGNTVWYVWTPAADIAVNISTDGSTEPGGDPLDTAHGVFTGSCGNLTEVACVDIGLTDNLFFEATAGVTYFIKFGEFLDGVGGGNLVVTVDLPPEPELFVLESVRNNLSQPISSLVTAPALAKRAAATSKTSTVKEIPLFMRDEGKVESLGRNGAMLDLLRKKSNVLKGLPSVDIQSSSGSSQAELLQIFDGAENDDNDNLVGFLLFPPDTDGDVGPNHYVQMTNLVTTIFDKSGNVVLGPFPNNVFFTGLGGRPENTNSGDPIVLYDEETDRWLVSQFAIDGTGFSLGIACSETGDPTGRYFQHEFDFTDIGFPDYPKYGFVTDAISVMVNLFAPFQGPGLGAIDKAEAFSRRRTTMVFFKVGTNEFGFVAGDNDGPVFDNMPPTFATNNGGTGNTIDIWEIDVNFKRPKKATISEVASLPVSPIDGDLCAAFRERCIDQPDGAPRLEAISDRLMHRLQMRDFGGGDKRAVVNHTVDAHGNGQAGVRWYEFRNGGSGWSLYQEDTFQPGNNNHRWMGSIAMNTAGEICLGYSISSQQTYPSIGVAGQTVGQSGTGRLDVRELVVHDGNVDQFVQTGGAARWGDYSAMAVDPVDDTFWYTQEYAKPNTRLGQLAGWATKIAQISLGGGLNKSVAEAETVPASYALLENYPNPFNPETEIRFQLQEASHVTVRIFNTLGHEIRTLTNKQYESGSHSVRWDSKDKQGNIVSSGTYFYELQAGNFTQVKKMTLLK